MASRVQLTAASAEFRATNPAVVNSIDASDARRLVLEFDGSTEQAADWTFVAPAALTTADLLFVMESATTGNAQWGVSIEAITPGDASPDLDSADSFDTENTGTAVTVPATAGLLTSQSITLTNDDGIAAGDLVRVRVTYKTASTAAGNAYLLAVDLGD